MYRQGDLLITKSMEIPKSAQVDKTGILLLGESTGHKHRIVGADLLRDKAAMYLDVKKTATIVHEEHHPIQLKPGKYSVLRQREYVSADMQRIVVD